MIFHDTELKDARLIELRLLGDERGAFGGSSPRHSISRDATRS